MLIVNDSSPLEYFSNHQMEINKSKPKLHWLVGFLWAWICVKQKMNSTKKLLKVSCGSFGFILRSLSSQWWVLLCMYLDKEWMFGALLRECRRLSKYPIVIWQSSNERTNTDSPSFSIMPLFRGIPFKPALSTLMFPTCSASFLQLIPIFQLGSHGRW